MTDFRSALFFVMNDIKPLILPRYIYNNNMYTDTVYYDCSDANNYYYLLKKTRKYTMIHTDVIIGGIYNVKLISIVFLR